VSGLVSIEYGDEVHAPTSSTENGVVRRWRHEGREKRSRMMNEVVATEARTTITVRRYRWPNRPCLASHRGTTHLIVSANPARALCGAWAVVSARSAGPSRIFFILQEIIYTYVQFIFNIINT
jgi:hypothetical protein